MFVLALAACEEPLPDYGMEFADVKEPILNVNWYETPGEAGRLQVLVNPEHVGACRPLPKIKAEIDGVPLVRLHGKVKDEAYDYDRDCTVYEFEARAPELAGVMANPKSKVTVTDGVTTLSVTVNHLFTPRKLVSVTDGGEKPAEELRYRVDPAGDIIGTEPKFGLLIEYGGQTARAAATMTEGVLSATLPPEVLAAEPVDGMIPLTITLTGAGYIQPSFADCTAKSCTAARAVAIEPEKLIIARLKR